MQVFKRLVVRHIKCNAKIPENAYIRLFGVKSGRTVVGRIRHQSKSRHTISEEVHPISFDEHEAIKVVTFFMQQRAPQSRARGRNKAETVQLYSTAFGEFGFQAVQLQFELG